MTDTPDPFLALTKWFRQTNPYESMYCAYYDSDEYDSDMEDEETDIRFFKCVRCRRGSWERWRDVYDHLREVHQREVVEGRVGVHELIVTRKGIAKWEFVPPAPMQPR
ncbi:hypothetical protein HDV00_008363 [Rhizophlyctis rosea]|nr:hypothetical protein HDV00_008363 [Rhizophlyctis rosea]